jgi:acylphosphatase
VSASTAGPETVCRRIVISGAVQGVTFRAATAREATKFPGLRGYVRNLPNGDLEVVVQSGASSVEAMIEWCYRGPPQARVENVQVTECKVDPALPYFTVRGD